MKEKAERDDAGRIIRGEITWDRKGHKATAGMPNTILGRIVTDGRRLTAEVNSARRARDLRRKIDARLRVVLPDWRGPRMVTTGHSAAD